MLFDDFFLNFDRQFVPNFFGLKRRVQKENGAFVGLSQHVDLFQEREMMARDEGSLVDQVRSIDDVVCETQVRRRHRAGLFGVIHEVCLTVGTVAARNDLDRVFVRADRTVRAQTEEDGALDVGVFNIKAVVNVQRQVRHVIGNADRKAGLRFGLFGVFKDGLRHGGRVFLGRQTVTAADNARHRFDLAGGESVAQRGNDIQEQRFALRTRFFRAVHNGNRLDRRGQSLNQGFGGERTVQMNLQNAVLFVQQVFDGRFRRIGGGSHDHDDLFGVGGADVINQMILTARNLGILVHRFLNNGGDFFIVRIGGFANLEEHVGVLRRSANDGAIRRQSVRTVERRGQAFNELLQVFVGNDVNLVDFVRRAETVKEVHEGNAGLQRRILGDRRHVLSFLNVVRAQHRQTDLAAGHHVGMIAENRQGVRRQRARGDMNDERGQLARDLVQVRDHQQQPLRRRKGRRQSARLQRAVNGADSARFGLHFIDFGNLAPNVFNACSRPGIREFAHRGRRGDRVNNGNFIQTMRNVSGRFVGVHHLHRAFIRHGKNPPKS